MCLIAYLLDRVCESVLNCVGIGRRPRSDTCIHSNRVNMKEEGAPDLYFVTGNQNKRRDGESILCDSAYTLRVLSIDLPEIQGEGP